MGQDRDDGARDTAARSAAGGRAAPTNGAAAGESIAAVGEAARRLVAMGDDAPLAPLLDVLPVLVTVYDPALATGGAAPIRLNRAFVATLGWTEDDARAGDLMAACYPDPAVRAAAVAHMGQPDAGWRELPTRAKDGRAVPVLWTNVTLVGDRQVGVGLDLTEQHAARARALAAEDAADAAEARLAAIVTGSQDAIVGHTVDGIITSWNPAAERLFGFPAAAMLGRSVLDIIPAERRAAEGEVLARLARGEMVPPFEAERLRQDGRRVAVSVGVSPVHDARGRLIGASKIVRDITAQRQHAVERERLLAVAERAAAEREAAAAHLRAIFEQAPVPIATLRGPDHVGEVENAAYRALVGGRDFVGRPVREVLPELAEQGFVALLDRVYATGEPYVGIDVAARVDDGHDADERFFTFVYQPLVEDGRTTGIMAVVLNVTEQVRARRDLEGARSQADALRAVAEQERAGAVRANRSKSEFLANMSHELRTPLNAIAGHVQLVELGIHGPVTPLQAEALARVQQAQRHLLRLINDVLNFAKLEAGRVEFDVRATAPAPLLHEVVDLVEGQVRTKGLALTLVVPPEATQETGDAWAVWADRDKLAQVLLNLLSNAIKFTPAGQPTGAAGQVVVTLRAPADAPGGIELQVTDTGIGIPADRLDAIFDPFVQVSAGLTRQYEGTGLGLAISRDLVRGMGGQLSVTSVAGAGSTFTVTLRRARGPHGVPTDRRTRPERRAQRERRADDRRHTPPDGTPAVSASGEAPARVNPRDARPTGTATAGGPADQG